MVLQNLLNGIKERNFRGIARQTEKLDPQTRQHLQEYLHSSIVGDSSFVNNNDNAEEKDASIQQELEELQDELSQASSRLKELKEKEEFIGTRLEAYRTKLKAIDVTATNDDDANNNDESPSSPSKQEILEKHQKALEQIQQVHDTMKHNIKVLQKKITAMEKRKLELQWHLEECQVVLETANQLELLETELAAEQAAASTDTDVTDGGAVEMMDLQLQEEEEETNNKHHSMKDDDGTIPVHTTTTANHKEKATEEVDDEEAGKMESVHDFEVKDSVLVSGSTITREEEEGPDSDERIHNDGDESIKDGLASRIAIAEDQV